MNGNATKVLDASRHFLGRIPIREMASRVSLTTEQVKDAFIVLIARGLATRAWKGVYRLTPKGLEALVESTEIKSGPTGPRPLDLPNTTIRTRIWRAIRVSRKGTVREFLTLASQGEEIGRDDAHRYLNALTSAGYLTRMCPRGEKSEPRWLLIRDTGPKAPQWNRRQKRVFDANTGDTYELA